MAEAGIETPPADENDDNWLYGDSNNDQNETEAPSVSDKDQQQINTSNELAVSFVEFICHITSFTIICGYNLCLLEIIKCIVIILQDNDYKENEETEGNEVTNDDSHFNDEHFGEVDREDHDQTNGDADSQDNGDSDSDDSDDVKVTIGEIKSGPQAYASLNIKVRNIYQYEKTCYEQISFLMIINFSTINSSTIF